MRSVPTTVNVTTVESSGLSVANVNFSTATLSAFTSFSSSTARETGFIALSKVFIIIQVIVSQKARVRFYSSAAARDADVARPNTIPPTPGTEHGVIGDWYLDTSDKYTWTVAPPVNGFNADSPQASQIYYTVHNLDSTNSASISVTLTYVSFVD
jgi:hypothetical protein